MTFLDNVENFCRAGHSTDDNRAHVLFMLDKQEYRRAPPEYVIFSVFYGNKVYANAPSSTFICTLSVFFSFVLCSHTANNWALNGNIKDSLVTAGTGHKAAKF